MITDEAPDSALEEISKQYPLPEGYKWVKWNSSPTVGVASLVAKKSGDCWLVWAHMRSEMDPYRGWTVRSYDSARALVNVKTREDALALVYMKFLTGEY